MTELESGVSKETPDSFFMPEEKSLAQWRFELKTLPKKHWNKFYYHFLGDEITNYRVFFRYLKLYGDMNVFEAVLFTARQSVEGDPLPYVLKVCHNLWKQEQQEIDKQTEYDKQAQLSIEESHKKNDELAAKIKKIRG